MRVQTSGSESLSALTETTGGAHRRTDEISDRFADATGPGSDNRLFDDLVNRSVYTVTELVTCPHTSSLAAPGTAVNFEAGGSRSDPSLWRADREICRSGLDAAARFCVPRPGLTRPVVRLAQRLPQTDEGKAVLVMPVIVNPERHGDNS